MDPFCPQASAEKVASHISCSKDSVEPHWSRDHDSSVFSLILTGKKVTPGKGREVNRAP